MFRSGSPRPLSKPRHTFALFSTPLSRAVRPLCSIRHLARCPSASIDFNETSQQWEKYVNEKPSRDVRNTCEYLWQIHQKTMDKKKNKHLKDVFALPEEENKSLEDFLPEIDRRTNESDVPIRYPKLLHDSADFYAQYTHLNLSIMKKRPYESIENSTEDPSPKRTLITRQNLIKTKSPVRINSNISSDHLLIQSTGKLPRSRAYTVPFVDRKYDDQNIR